MKGLGSLTEAAVGSISSEDMRKRLTVLTFGAIAMAGASVLVTSAEAQGRDGVVFASTGRGGAVVLGGAAGTGSSRAHRSRRFFAGSGFAPYFYSDSEPETIEGPGQVLVARGAAEAAPQVAKPADSVLLELRGDRWVRITNYGASTSGGGTEGVTAGGAERAAAPGSASVGARGATGEVAAELPRAALVFRDGRTEEIRKYVIVGATLYTTGDYWSTGSWTRKIAIAELDVPATLKLNRERGTKFSLPSRPTEVMMRP
jgi:hypothetical protein